MWRHVTGNALLPVLNIAGLLLGELIAGALITETVFGRSGLGQLTQQAVNNQDIAVLQAVVMISALGFVLINLLVDLLDAAARSPSANRYRRCIMSLVDYAAAARKRVPGWQGVAWQLTRLAWAVIVRAFAAVALPGLLTHYSPIEGIAERNASGAAGGPLAGHRSTGRDVYTRIVYGASTP